MNFLSHMMRAAREYKQTQTGLLVPEDDRPMIQFLCTEDVIGVAPHPVPAGKMIPEWYKRIKRHVSDGGRDHFGGAGMTAKACLPMLDAMTMGYIIPLAADINIRTDDKRNLTPGNEGRTPTPTADLHGPQQLGGLGNISKFPAVKFLNPWIVRTDPGWSTLFVSPINGDEKRFTCLAAVVDTDTYPKQVNFPAIWHAENYDGVVKAGTPLVVAIPFKRQDMNIEHIVRVATKAEMDELHRIQRVQQTRQHYYTQELREKR